MTTALEGVCGFVEGNPGDEWEHFQFDTRFMRDAVEQIRTLQREFAGNRCELESWATKVTAAREERDRSEAREKHLCGVIIELKDLIRKCAMENWLQSQEIQRLRHATPAISASGAIESNGNITIQADHVEITGTVHA